MAQQVWLKLNHTATIGAGAFETPPLGPALVFGGQKLTQTSVSYPIGYTKDYSDQFLSTSVNFGVFGYNDGSIKRSFYNTSLGESFAVGAKPDPSQLFGPTKYLNVIDGSGVLIPQAYISFVWVKLDYTGDAPIVTVKANQGASANVIEGGDAEWLTFSLSKAVDYDIEINIDTLSPEVSSELLLVNDGRHYIISAGKTSLSTPVVAAKKDNLNEYTEETELNFTATALKPSGSVVIQSGLNQQVQIFDRLTQPIGSDQQASNYADGFFSIRDIVFYVIDKSANAKDLSEGFEVFGNIAAVTSTVVNIIGGFDIVKKQGIILDQARTKQELDAAKKQIFVDFIDYASKIGLSTTISVALGAAALTPALPVVLLGLGVAAIGTGLLIEYDKIQPFIRVNAADYYDIRASEIKLPPQASLFGGVSHDSGSYAGKVTLLYDGLLGRAPDPLGLEGWTASLKTGASVYNVAAAFLTSPEGQARAGAADNATFVEQLYQANLHRASDPSGKAGWLNALDLGASRTDVALGFALSNEHIVNLKSVFDVGVYVPDQDASSMARLYHGILDRAPDAGGLQGWKSAVKAGTSLHDVAVALLNSSEYEIATTGRTDAQFVTDLYQQVLDRAGDSQGVQGWNGYLNAGGARGAVINGFTDSFEFQNKYAGQSSPAYVEQLYEHILGRPGDSAGLQGWANSIDSGAASRTDVAHAFTGSAEFQAKYVGPSNADFVDDIYENALGRHVDAGGLQGWTDVLANGTSRADVAVAIAQSAEAQQHLVSVIEQGWQLA